MGVSIVQSQDAPPPPIIDSRDGGLPVDCLSHCLFLPFQVYYIITDYIVLHAYLIVERPSVLEVPVFCNCQPSHIHNRLLRNWICPHPVLTLVDPKGGIVSSHLTVYLRLLTMNLYQYLLIGSGFDLMRVDE